MTFSFVATKDYNCSLKFPTRDNFTTCELKNVKYNGREKINVNFNESLLLASVGNQSQLQFVNQVKFTSSKLDGVPNAVFDTFKELKVLDASDSSVHYINALTFVFATSLEQIFIHSNRLTRLNPYCYVHTKNLTLLDLSDNQISTVSSYAFNALENLETLSLSNNRIKALDDFVFRPLLNLKWLWLDRNKLNLISSELFSKVNANLEGIYLQHNSLDMISPFVLDHLPKLRFILLDGNNCVSRSFKNHFIQGNTSIKLELRSCFKAFLKAVENDAAKYNVTLALYQTRDDIEKCVEDFDELKMLLQEVQNQVDELAWTKNWEKY